MSVGLRPLRSPEDYQHVSGLHAVHLTHKERGALFRDITTFHVAITPREQLPVDFRSLVCRDFVDTGDSLTESLDPAVLPNHLLAEAQRRRHYLRKRPCDDRNEKETAQDPVNVLICTFPPPASLHVHALLKSGAAPKQVADYVWRIAARGYQAVIEYTGWLGLGYGIHTDTKSLHFECAITRFLPSEPTPQFPHAKRSLDLVGPETVGIERQRHLGAKPTADTIRILDSNLRKYGRRKNVAKDPNDIRISRAIDAECEAVFGTEYKQSVQLYCDWHKQHLVHLTENTAEFQWNRADELADKNQELIREISGLKNTISDHKQTIKILDTDLVSTKRRLDEKVKTMITRDQTINDLKEKVTQLEGEIASLQDAANRQSNRPDPQADLSSPDCDTDVEPLGASTGREDLLRRVTGDPSIPKMEQPSKDSPPLTDH